MLVTVKNQERSFVDQVQKNIPEVAAEQASRMEVMQKGYAMHGFPGYGL
jgi:hypothetical protein